MRIEKEGPPYRDDGSLNYTESASCDAISGSLLTIWLLISVEDPFSILSVFAPEILSQPRLTRLYPPREPPDMSFPTPTTLHFPETGFKAIARGTTTSPGERYHWNITRNVPVRTKFKERDEDDTTGLSHGTRHASTVDWGALAILEGVLRGEMDKRGQRVDAESAQEALFETIRESLDTVESPALDDTQGYWSFEQIQDAEAYLRDIVYGGIDGAAYLRSLAEFVHRDDDDAQVGSFSDYCPLPLIFYFVDGRPRM
jgi:bromodomain-containing protein 7/9